MFIAQRGLRCYLLGINRPDDKRDRRVLTRDRVIDERSHQWRKDWDEMDIGT